jgi:hypothetical protein
MTLPLCAGRRASLAPGLLVAMSVAATAGLAGCGGRAVMFDDRDADADARSANLDAFPLTKPVLPPLTVPSHRVSPPTEQTLAGEPAVAYLARRPTPRTAQSVIADATADLLADPAVRGGVAGPVVLVYRGATTDLDRPFDLEIGVVVRPDVKPTGKGVAVHPLPPLRALAVTFDGPASALDKGYDRLLPEVRARGLRPTGEVREVYARWQDVLPDETDDLSDVDVLIAVGVEP